MRFLLCLTIVGLSLVSRAEVNSGYKSEEDVALTARTISLLPVFDNLRGIYSRPVEADLIEKIKSGHRFEFVEATTAGPVLSPDELEEDVDSLNSIFQNATADALIATSISKGPSGIAIKMDLFLKADRLLLAQEALSNIQRFDVEAIKKLTADMYSKLVKHLPYNGLVLSRQGTRVTLNMGHKDGIEPEQVLPVIQIIKSTRHPRFHFLISTEKEIIGKIKVLKVDDTLSFGRIVTEKGAGTIQANAKIASLENVNYTNTDSLSDNHTGEDSLSERPDADVNYGKKPVAWLPERKPTFGVVGARLGLGSYQENVETGTNSLSATDTPYPSIALEGELWLTPAWSMHAQLRQGIISSQNPMPSSQPSKLSHRLAAYDFLFGYNMRLASSVSSPKVELLFGFSSYELFVDSSSPQGLTTKAYSGPKLGVSGSYPVGEGSPYSFGANLNFLFQSRLNETPNISGNGSNTATAFGTFVDKQLHMNLKARVQLDFEMYSSTFSGGASASQKHTTLSGGLYYLF